MAAGKMPPPERGRETTGRVAQLTRGRSCGLIRARDGQSVFFHRGDLVGAKYSDVRVGTSVRFELVADPISGPRAMRVRVRSTVKAAAPASASQLDV